MERITVLCACLERLHARLDHAGENSPFLYAAQREEYYALERHSSVNGDETGDRSHGECDAAGQGLTRACAALHGLLERGVRREANSRISTLPHHLTVLLNFCFVIIKLGRETHYGEQPTIYP